MSGPESPAQPTLRRGALTLPAVLMQGLSHIAPAAGIVLSIQFIAKEAGPQAPLCYGLAFLCVLLLGVSLTQLARHLPSAGGYFTYVSRAVHPRAGFLTAWLYFLYDPASTAINLAFLGALLQPALRKAGVPCPWWLIVIVGALAIAALAHRGVKASLWLLSLLALAEVLVLLALSGVGALHPGPLAATPPLVPAQGLFLGVVLALFSFTGFESVAPLAEETAAPRRTLPRAILWSIVLSGIFYCFCAWALLRAWGTSDLVTFQTSSEYPVFLLAQRHFGAAWLLVPLALINSVIAVSIACTNAATRVFYAMGRQGALPAWLARVHPQHRTPTAAIALQTAITLVVGVGLGACLGPEPLFFFLGLVMTLGMVLVYSAGNLGVFLLYRGELRARFNLLLHAVFPLLSTLALCFVAVQSVVPLPAAPLRYAPLVVLGWLLLGVAVLWRMRRRGQEDWLLRAGQAAHGGEG